MSWKSEVREEIRNLYRVSEKHKLKLPVFYAGTKEKSIWFYAGYDWCYDNAFGRAEASDYVIVASMLKINSIKNRKGRKMKNEQRTKH